MNTADLHRVLTNKTPEAERTNLAVWLANVSVADDQGPKIALSVPSAFVRDCFEKRYGAYAREFFSASGFDEDVVYRIDPRPMSGVPKTTDVFKRPERFDPLPVPEKRRASPGRPLNKSLVPGVHPKNVIEAVSAHYGVTEDEIMSSSREHKYVRPRQVAMYLVRNYLGYSFPSTAKEFNRDHTTVIHGIKRLSKLSNKDERLARDLAVLRGRLTDLVPRPA